MTKTYRASLHAAAAARRFAPVAVLTALLALLAPAAAASADELIIGGVAHRDLRITGLRGDLLLYETAAGNRRQASVGSIDVIRLDDHPALADAEELANDGDFAAAAEGYAGVLEAMADDEDLRVLVQAKLVASLDSAGEREQAVRQYVALIADDQSDLALAAQPRRLPQDEETRASLMELVSEQARRASGAVARRPLNDLYERLEAEPDDEESMEEEASSSLIGRRARAATDAIDRLIADEDYEQALEEVEQAIEDSDGVLARRLHQRGVILAALDRDRDAALSFMRVVIHYPSSRNRYYIPSLIEAGKAFVNLDQPEHARQLWDEARAESDDEAELEQIDQLLGSLP